MEMCGNVTVAEKEGTWLTATNKKNVDATAKAFHGEQQTCCGQKERLEPDCVATQVIVAGLPGNTPIALKTSSQLDLQSHALLRDNCIDCCHHLLGRHLLLTLFVCGIILIQKKAYKIQ